jgi:malate synthase
MRTPFMSAYSLATISACHQHAAHAMGGMAAFIPIKGDKEANDRAMKKIIDDKTHEAMNGHDGKTCAFTIYTNNLN